MGERPEGNGLLLPETPARPQTPAETTTHTTPLCNGVRSSKVPPTLRPCVESPLPLVQTAIAPPPPPPPDPLPTVKIEPATISKSHIELQPAQIRKICRDFIRGSCSRESKCRHSHEYDQRQIKDVLVFCHDFQNKECNRPNCRFVHATIHEAQAYYDTGNPPRAILENNRNGQIQSCHQSTTIDLNDLITRPPPSLPTTNPVGCNPQAPTHLNQEPREVFPQQANLSRPPPAVPKWNYIHPNWRPTIHPPPPTESFIQPPAGNLPLMSYYPLTNQPPPTDAIKDNRWPASSSQPPIKSEIHAADRSISMKRTWTDIGDHLNVSPRHKTMRMDFRSSCSNCELLDNQLLMANNKIEEMLKTIIDFERWQKEAEKQKSLLTHISSIIGNSQTKNQTHLGDNVHNNTLLNLGLPVASLCTPHTQMPMQSGLDLQQINMQLPSLQLSQLLQPQRNPNSNDQQMQLQSLQLPQLLQLQTNHASIDQQMQFNNPPSSIGNNQNWCDTNPNGQQQNMMLQSYSNSQVMPPGRQLTPQQQQVFQLLDSNGFSVSYK